MSQKELDNEIEKLLDDLHNGRKGIQMESEDENGSNNTGDDDFEENLGDFGSNLDTGITTTTDDLEDDQISTTSISLDFVDFFAGPSTSYNEIPVKRARVMAKMCLMLVMTKEHWDKIT